MSAQLSSDTSSSLGGDPLIGRMFGAYRVVRRIGEGGMGVVYEGRGAGTPARAAIKVLHPNLANDGKTLQRFFNEARAIRAVKHSGIVEILDFGQQPDGLAFILMEYLDGETLLVRMEQANARGEALGLCSVVQLSQQITAALLAIHERNIVHRDLKPENIFIIPDPQLPSGERVKLLDFGIAAVRT